MASSLLGGGGDEREFGGTVERFDRGFPSQGVSSRIHCLAVSKGQRSAVLRVFGALAGAMGSHSLLQVVGDTGVEAPVGALDDIDKPHVPFSNDQRWLAPG